MKAIRLARLVDPRRPLTYGIVQAGDDYPGGIPYIRPSDMDGHRGVKLDQLRTTSPEIAAAYSRSRLRSGDIVVSIGPGYGKSLVVDETLVGANLTQGTARVAAANDVSVRYLQWALQSKTSTSFWDSEVAGATFKALNLAPLARTPIPAHDSVTQTFIADYLDRETARIDALIGEQDRLVGMLRERRRAVVERLVSSGLVAYSPVKPSRLRWAGDVPRHWRVGNIRRFAAMKTGHTPS